VPCIDLKKAPELDLLYYQRLVEAGQA